VRFVGTLLTICLAGLFSASAALAQDSAPPGQTEFFATAGGGLYTQTCTYDGCRSDRRDHKAVTAGLIATVGLYPKGGRSGFGGEFAMSGTLSGAEENYKAPAADAAHRNTSLTAMFHIRRQSPRFMYEMLVGGGLVVVRNQRTLVCDVPSSPPSCGSPTARAPRRFNVTLPTVVGGVNVFTRSDRFAIGPMLRIGVVPEYKEVGGSIYDTTSGLFTFSAALAVRLRF
jgi:hypothetical protein